MPRATVREEVEGGGDGGIRTLDTGLGPYNGLANRRLQPLGHVSAAVRPGAFYPQPGPERALDRVRALARELSLSAEGAVTPTNDRDALAIGTLRFLAVDMVEAAKSGHPGAPLGQAPLAHLLWTRHLRFDPADPAWADARPLRPFLRPRLGAALRAAPPRRLRPADRRARALPAARIEDAGAPRARPHRRGRDHDRTARAGVRQRGRHGDGAAHARRALRPSWLRAVRPPRLRLRLRRRSDGGGRLRGGLARRPPPARAPQGVLGRQPDHDRRRDRAGVERAGRGALRRLRLADVCASTTATTSRSSPARSPSPGARPNDRPSSPCARTSATAARSRTAREHTASRSAPRRRARRNARSAGPRRRASWFPKARTRRTGTRRTGAPRRAPPGASGSCATEPSTRRRRPSSSGGWRASCRPAGATRYRRSRPPTAGSRRARRRGRRSTRSLPDCPSSSEARPICRDRTTLRSRAPRSSRPSTRRGAISTSACASTRWVRSPTASRSPARCARTSAPSSSFRTTCARRSGWRR